MRTIFLYAFDSIELNSDDLRRDPLEGRKATLEMILAKAGVCIRFNEHMEGGGETVFRDAGKLGLEDIVCISFAETVAALVAFIFGRHLGS